MASVFTDVGETLTTDLWDGTITAPTNWFVAQGTGAGAAAKGDTALTTESAEARVATADTQPSADQNQHVGTITATGSRAIIEMGLFDAATTGNMPVRADFTAINVVSGDKIEFTVQITTA